MKIKKISSLNVVVKVESGIPVTAEIYRNVSDAIDRENTLRKHMNYDNDETGIFNVKIR